MTGLEVFAIIEGAAYVISGAAIIAALTPTKKDDVILGKVRRVIDLLAFNFGNAKNKE